MTDLPPSTAADGSGANQPSKPLVTYRPDYFRRQGKIWLVVSLLVLVLWFVLWLFMQSPTSPTQKPKQAAANVLDIANLPTHIDSMDEAKNLVSSINVDAVVQDLRAYPPEFKGKSYFSQNKNKWSVTVMDVAEHEVIVTYLSSRKDRDKFAYFRYTDSNGQMRYLLTYGAMSSFTEAMGASRTIDWGLPSSARVYPEEMKRYVEMIDNYERAAETLDVGSGIKEIDLQETNQEVPPEPAVQKPTAKSENDENQASLEAAKEMGQKDNKLAVPPTAVPITMGNPPSQATELGNTQPAQNNRPRSEPTKDNGKSDIPITQAVPQRQAERQPEQSKPLPVQNAAPPSMTQKPEQIQATQSDESY